MPKTRRTDLRNVAIIAHVDHGKTTLVDCLLKSSGQFRDAQLTQDCILDSNDQERERGITILAKNIALSFDGVKVNIIDTPGHADFGGEVERVLQMADGCLVLVDAFEGPRPQTRFVLQKALEVGLRPIVVVKVDRPDARPQEALSEAFDLFVELGADDATLDFPYIFASGRSGFATHDPTVKTDTIKPLLEMILDKVPGPEIDNDGPLQMMVTSLSYSSFVGRIATGKIVSGSIRPGQQVVLTKADGSLKSERVVSVEVFDKLGRTPVEVGTAGDIVALVGLEKPEIGDTVTDPQNPQPLPRIKVDEPTLSMVFTINSSPLAGQGQGAGKYLTSRHIRDRLTRELEANVALRVEESNVKEAFIVSGRGVLHLSVLIETMRREGYELSVGKPQVIRKKIDDVWHEPFELLVVDVPSTDVGPVMEVVGARRGEMVDMITGTTGMTHLRFSIPARGLIGIRTRMLNATKGEAIIHHQFDCYKPLADEVPHRMNGVLVSQERGKVVAFALAKLQERADLFVAPGQDVYEGMIVGENSRDNDMVVNPIREKKLTNMRASGSDENVILKPPRQMSLEAALEYIEDDEYVEVTPIAIRLRKIGLTEQDRKQQNRAMASV